MNLRQAIKIAITWGEELRKRNAVEANLYERGVNNPVNENSWKRRKKIDETLKVLRDYLKQDDLL